MSSSPDILRCLLLPMQEGQLLLPSASVVEVLPYPRLQRITSAPEWVLGRMPWRMDDIPVVAAERLIVGVTPVPGSRTRVAVIKAVRESASIEHYAMVTQAVPRLVTLQRSIISPDDDQPAPPEGVLSSIRIARQAAWIPDLHLIEEQLVQWTVAGAEVE